MLSKHLKEPTTSAARSLYQSMQATDSPKIPFIPRSSTISHSYIPGQDYDE